MDKQAKYAKPEHERRFLLEELPVGAFNPVRIRDRYLHDTGIRLRRVETMDGKLVELKLGYKWRPDTRDPRVIMHTSVYLDDTEFALLRSLPGNDLVKTRYRVQGRPNWAVDVHESPKAGPIILEVNFGDIEEAAGFEPPDWADRDVTRDEAYTGAGLSRV